MKCPYCDNIDTKVIDSRPTEEGHAIRRRRGCDACGRRFTTYEKVEESILMGYTEELPDPVRNVLFLQRPLREW